MVIVTGAAGFIGSCLAKALLANGHELILVDDFTVEGKTLNLLALSDCLKVERSEFFEWLEVAEGIDVIYHIGARTDTSEMDVSIFDELNLDFSKRIWSYCTDEHIPLVYASSAATYGSGELGYSDDHQLVSDLKPLNPYGESKNDFDKWVLFQTDQPPQWYGLKFFNVYGPNEYHKGRMASVVFHTFHQVQSTGMMKLFRSHNEKYRDGEQLRDFVYVKDVVSVIQFLISNEASNGIYNLGTGQARTFVDLATAVFNSLESQPAIEFIDTPIDIRDKYQYFTQANMSKLHAEGYDKPFFSLEQGVEDYVKNYLGVDQNY
ncbi:MAG: ADP-glyceromanno-heptose 6-epimerase [Flavobacteriales bacterium]|jgi:ADP-L-glycero-D-manno-heptose 6-epimerase|nr:ADP-glyceromanno-heptose 6-epimerase [Flavobacteriales bacterium]NCG29860.1 ADP-glyceromanno-heptose 6-epimerase [Bacteroidota bacterium]MBT3963013.1 ADP-glyceromanno-heptose 6-epimerase [Flavobacteriales bacterium]MBT4704862.1 ADP-glyceromanno-heptose 6-epimerase [Flavobacteriales bacterium]MBT4929637.1 ADP-glyceromanno-heptose 6-epimerase [Flavobacteriales bacterium]